MRILRSRRYQELLIAEQRVKDFLLTIELMGFAEVEGEKVQREWDRTLGKAFQLEYRLEEPSRF
jgi:hypothetical protein